MDGENARAEAPDARQRLADLRLALLRLHKVLVESERAEYEQTMGKVKSATHLLQLLTTDPWFAWLSPLSRLIVTLDEVLEEEEPMTSRRLEKWIKESSSLLVASEEGSAFARNYYVALQRDPDVVMAHAEVAKVRGWKKSRGAS